ncbi:MAG: FlgD immunoglobulin-like domain containing protein [Candidatus Zixiibacteriota bacterium]
MNSRPKTDKMTRQLSDRVQMFAFVLTALVLTFSSTNGLFASPPELEWVHSWGGSAADYGTGVAIAPTGEVYQAGWTFSSSGVSGDFMLLKWNHDGSLAWDKSWDFGTNEIVRRVAIAPNGDVVVVGDHNYGAYTDNALLARVSSGGSLLWAKTWSVGWEVANDVIVDEYGNIYICGPTGSANSSQDIFVSKYDEIGQLMWSKRCNLGGHQGASHLAISGNGVLYVVGEMGSSLSPPQDAILFAFDEEGNFLWGRRWDSGSDERTSGIALGSNNSVYITGTVVNGGLGGLDTFVLKFDEDGNLLWQKAWGGAGSDAYSVISIDSDDHIYVAGRSSSYGSSSYGIYLIEYESDGALLDQRLWEGGGNEEPRGIAIGNANEIYVSGFASNSAGNWQEIAGLELELSGSVTTVYCSTDDIAGSESSPTGIETSFTGTLDTGGGGSDALLIALSTGAPTYAAMDIKPGSCPNSLNINAAESEFWMCDDGTIDEVGSGTASDEFMKISPAKKRGVLPCAILGTAEFDVSEIDVASVMLEGVSALRHSYEDVSTPIAEDAEACACTDAGSDGYLDLTLKLDKTDVASTLGEINVGDVIPLEITGQLLDGTPFTGTDCVVIVGNPHASKTMPDGASMFGLVNHPNPFNPTTHISFSLPTDSYVKLAIYNIMGQRVSTLVDDYKQAGYHTVTWSGRNDSGASVASGVYFYRILAGDHSETKKMLLMK